MRITAKQLRKLISEAAASGLNEDHDLDQYDEYLDDEDDSEFFLHGHEDGHAHDAEGSMAKSQLHRVKEMSYMLCDMLDEDDQLPAWVQSHIAIAYENLNQVVSYMEPKFHMHGEEDDDYDYDFEEDEYEDEEYYEDEEEMMEGLDEAGLWDNIWAKRRRGEAPAQPGDKNYPKSLNVGGGRKKKRKKR